MEMSVCGQFITYVFMFESFKWCNNFIHTSFSDLWSGFGACKMGNSRAQERRHGVKRPGPAQRVALSTTEVSHERDAQTLLVSRENAAERQRQCRARRRNLEEESHQLAMVGQGGEFPIPCRRDVLRVSSKITAFIVNEMHNELCDGPRF